MFEVPVLLESLVNLLQLLIRIVILYELISQSFHFRLLDSQFIVQFIVLVLELGQVFLGLCYPFV